jgi:hypothetical protein
MTYAANTITLNIKDALSGAACGDQLVIALYTNKFLDANIKYQTADIYYTPNFVEITAGAFSATLTIPVSAPADQATMTSIVAVTFSARVYIKNNADDAVIFNVVETPGNTIEVSGTDFLVNVNFINLAEGVITDLALKVISTTDPAVTNTYSSAGKVVANTNITGIIIAMTGYTEGSYVAALTYNDTGVTKALPLFVKDNVAQVVNFTVDSDTATTLVQLDFAATATILACDTNFNPHVLIGSYDQATFLHSRSNFSTIASAVTVGYADT